LFTYVLVANKYYLLTYLLTMKIRNRAQLFLAISDFEPQIMLSICLDYHCLSVNIQLLFDHESVWYYKCYL